MHHTWLEVGVRAVVEAEVAFEDKGEDGDECQMQQPASPRLDTMRGYVTVRVSVRVIVRVRVRAMVTLEPRMSCSSFASRRLGVRKRMCWTMTLPLTSRLQA